ncbi:MAG: DUF2461 family protein, partial [Bacteroidota bacterium]
NGEMFQDIINQNSFKSTFGDLYEDEKLSRPPKGFSKDHPHIELLKNKTFAVVHNVSNTEVLKPGFEDKIVQVYMEMLPFRRYLNEAAMI